MSRHDDSRNENSSGARSSGGNSEMCRGLLCFPIIPMQAIEGTRLAMVLLQIPVLLWKVEGCRLMQ